MEIGILEWIHSLISPIKSLQHLFLRKLDILPAVILAFFATSSLSITTVVLASATSNLTQTINAGTLSVDIVNVASEYASVASPTFAMTAATMSFACQTVTGTFGTNPSQVIYVKNPDAADGGWAASLAASATTAVWDGAASDFDFNDPTTSGCTDSADADSVAGQLTVDPSAGTLTAGQCASCVTTNVTKGSSSAFVEGTTNSITVLTGAVGSDDIGDWKLTGVSLSQTIPAEQAAASDYDINMVLTVAAS